MSLQIWLPLNGNLENKGCCPINAATQSTAPTYVAGKLGKAMSTGAFYIPAAYVEKFYNNDAMSFAFWIYPTGSGSSHILGQSAMAAGNNRMYTIFQYPNPVDLHLSWQSNESGSTFFSVTDSNAFVANTWNHCAITYNGSQVLIYINGALKFTHACTKSPRTSFSYDVPVPSVSIRYLNDLRIYNHVLSAKEVKEISKALICHLPLNDLTGNANLLKLSTKGAGLNQTTYNLQDYNFSEALIDGTTYTITCKINMSYEKKSFAVYHSGGSILCGSWQTNVGSGIYKWSFTATSAMASQTSGDGHGFARVYVSNNNGGQGSTALSGTANVDWIKIEKGSTSTCYIPNSTDPLYSTLNFNGATVYDTSGYNNNGTMSTTKPIVFINSARYNAAMSFTNGAYISIPIPTITDYANSYTFSWWAKCTAYEGKMYWGFSNGNRLNLYGTGGVYCCNTGDGANNKFNNVSFSGETDNKWHHFAITGDGTTTKLYIDGVFKANATTYKAITGTTIILNGWDTGTSYKFNGQLSDFRLYATVLSANDIMELYNKPVSIDNTGKIHAIEYSEV